MALVKLCQTCELARGAYCNFPGGDQLLKAVVTSAGIYADQFNKVTQQSGTLATRAAAFDFYCQYPSFAAAHLAVVQALGMPLAVGSEVTAELTDKESPLTEGVAQRQ